MHFNTLSHLLKLDIHCRKHQVSGFYTVSSPTRIFKNGAFVRRAINTLWTKASVKQSNDKQKTLTLICAVFSKQMISPCPSTAALEGLYTIRSDIGHWWFWASSVQSKTHNTPRPREHLKFHSARVYHTVGQTECRINWQCVVMWGSMKQCWALNNISFLVYYCTHFCEVRLGYKWVHTMHTHVPNTEPRICSNTLTCSHQLSP